MIVVVPKKTLSQHDKNTLRKAEVIVIECDEPEKVRLINPEVNIQSDEYFMAALETLVNQYPTSMQEKFCNNLFKRLSKNNLSQQTNK